MDTKTDRVEAEASESSAATEFPSPAPERCSYCNGSGQIMNGYDIYWYEYWEKCPRCGGTGFVAST